MSMLVGVVKIADDEDFDRLKTMCQSTDGWTQVYNKSGVAVYTKRNDVSDFNLYKIQGHTPDVSADTLYDVLHDSQYRKSWDTAMTENFEICRINPTNEIGYYGMKLVKPLMNRDFVTQRSWLDLGKEKYIFNHSVNHAACPPKKNYIRAISYMTGYYIVSTADNPSQPGCDLSYITQSDPKGKLPVWAVNFGTTLIAPKIAGKLAKACRGYESWKSQHQPDHKPWRFPEQSTLPPLNPDDIRPLTDANSPDLIDESNAVEEAQ